MSSPAASSRFYAARLAGTGVFDPIGDQVGRIRDVVLVPQDRRPARAVGFVVEIPGRRRIFLGATRVMSISTGQVIMRGELNPRRFEMRRSEVLVIGDLLDRVVTLTDGSGEATVQDVALEQKRPGEWEVSRLFVRRRRHGGALSKLVGRGETMTVDWDEATGLLGSAAEQSAQLLLASYSDLKIPDLADLVHEMDPKRRREVAEELSDERLANMLEELPEDTRVEIVSGLDTKRVADVLDVMDPDDAADLLQEVPERLGEALLQLMEPEEAADVRRLLEYDEYTAGGMMTTEPIMVSPEAPVAQCLAMISRQEISPALAAMVYVCRQPLETPTGRFLGAVHFQHLLRERPERPVGEILDSDYPELSADSSLSEVTREMAAYNLVSLPVVDEHNHLLGAVTVDDVLDHVLPEDWREQDDVDAAVTGQMDLREIAAEVNRSNSEGR
ncbi:CBS domain-containing protein [Helcobacillus massiliensis]|uniref:CBS domain-containing protein/sporulation protein YlmC with PRC-barrel domain n=1 Tax=Helcobacillus massiliensis TaxID=521392 RepID=A0A839QR35_9MICO|nr:CBS domain-containing protein [Helcobacillus massiliensis]MCG7427541.1 CBS domain-containing protein [Helcobacillus sp. ACRRO]MBB3022774.1 CBS domain-containing protein/sporulation protein YlmC with PRC-barrel domain [Helcobacillus massiliensis]MCT1558222.1 CBS domain-containing protein [Helcobacillus massiliensis]MCT2036423.1 CBS domain-containing protein [Helcobacillus massiliensis]MCT2332227.1 CBS domain-containing protein [Helcobacillus massiliensis]